MDSLTYHSAGMIGRIMQRLKLKNGYHDARIRGIRYSENEDIAINVNLCNCSNESPSPATLHFFGVRNFAEVRDALEKARRANAERGYIDEIIGILRDDQRRYLLDLDTAGAVTVDAHGLLEM